MANEQEIDIDNVVEEDSEERDFDKAKDVVVEEKYVQKELHEFSKFPKQYILLNCNPVIAVPSMGDDKPVRK
jgi:hypothetical protein